MSDDTEPRPPVNIDVDKLAATLGTRIGMLTVDLEVARAVNEELTRQLDELREALIVPAPADPPAPLVDVRAPAEDVA